MLKKFAVYFVLSSSFALSAALPIAAFADDDHDTKKSHIQAIDRASVENLFRVVGKNTSLIPFVKEISLRGNSYKVSFQDARFNLKTGHLMMRVAPHPITILTALDSIVGAGYKVREVEVEEGGYEFHVVTPKHKRSKLFVDGKTGKVSTEHWYDFAAHDH